MVGRGWYTLEFGLGPFSNRPGCVAASLFKLPVDDPAHEVLLADLLILRRRPAQAANESHACRSDTAD